MSFKSDFPIFQKHPDIVYFDNTASVQKPQVVIDAIARFLSEDYANIHRGSYDLSERSETIYHDSKKAVARLIGAGGVAEISYHYNSTYALNFLSLSLAYSGILQKGDRVLLSVAEHHANIVPWLILKKWFGIEVDFFGMTPEYGIDFADLEAKLTDRTKVVSMTYASNVTGAIFDVPRAGEMIKNRENPPIFIVDASQAVPNFRIDVTQMQADAVFFTGHKIMTDTGLGVLWGRKEFLKSLTPAIGGGGAINFVTEEEYAPAGLPDKMEPGTPHIVGAASLLAAIGYIESIGGYEVIEDAEKPLIDAMLAGFEELKDQVKLHGPTTSEARIGVFSFEVIGKHPTDVADALADLGVCVRSGFHCAEPLDRAMKATQSDASSGTVRASVYFYNDLEDVRKFFEALKKVL